MLFNDLVVINIELSKAHSLQGTVYTSDVRRCAEAPKPVWSDGGGVSAKRVSSNGGGVSTKHVLRLASSKGGAENDDV